MKPDLEEREVSRSERIKPSTPLDRSPAPFRDGILKLTPTNPKKEATPIIPSARASLIADPGHDHYRISPRLQKFLGG
jgi:hypothetical protein